MERYAFCSKILEDIRILRVHDGIISSEPLERMRRSWRGVIYSKNSAGKASLETLTHRSRGLIVCDDKGRVCPDENFMKKCGKNSRFLSFCPLIVLTKGDTMINNMVLSREIEWIGYEHKRNMLQVEFIVGSIYQYENVPETVYQEFLTAPSHGRFFESNIKNKYHVRKVR